MSGKRVRRPASALLLFSIVALFALVVDVTPAAAQYAITPPAGRNAAYIAGHDWAVTGVGGTPSGGSMTAAAFDGVFDNYDHPLLTSLGSNACDDGLEGAYAEGLSYCGHGMADHVCSMDASPQVGGFVDHSDDVTYNLRCVGRLTNSDGSCPESTCVPSSVRWGEMNAGGGHWLSLQCGGSSSGATLAASKTDLYVGFWQDREGSPAADGYYYYAWAVECTIPGLSVGSESCTDTWSTWANTSGRRQLRSGCSSSYSTHVGSFGEGDAGTFCSSGKGCDEMTSNGFSGGRMVRYGFTSPTLSGALGQWPAYYPTGAGGFSTGSFESPGGDCELTSMAINGPDGFPFVTVDDPEDLGEAVQFPAGTYTAVATPGENVASVSFSWNSNLLGVGELLGPTAATAGVPVSFEFEVPASTGAFPLMLITSFYARNPSGQPCSVVGVTGEPGNGAPSIDPGTPGEDLAGCIDDFTEGGFWGIVTNALNPANYIKATGCVFRWAFVPDDGFDDGIREVRDAYNGSAVSSVYDLWDGPAQALDGLRSSGSAGCGGVDVPLAGTEVAVMDACDGIGEDIRGVALVAMRVTIYLGGAMACARLVARAFGIEQEGAS